MSRGAAAASGGGVEVAGVVLVHGPRSGRGEPRPRLPAPPAAAPSAVSPPPGRGRRGVWCGWVRVCASVCAPYGERGWKRLSWGGRGKKRGKKGGREKKKEKGGKGGKKAEKREEGKGGKEKKKKEKEGGK